MHGTKEELYLGAPVSDLISSVLFDSQGLESLFQFGVVIENV